MCSDFGSEPPRRGASQLRRPTGLSVRTWAFVAWTESLFGSGGSASATVLRPAFGSNLSAAASPSSSTAESKGAQRWTASALPVASLPGSWRNPFQMTG